MPVTYEFHKVPYKDIHVDRENRQRSDLSKIDELAESIKRLGLIHPIVITRDNRLVSGERRLTAWAHLSEEHDGGVIGFFDNIPVHYVDELDEYELSAIELEENVKRSNIDWKDSAVAIFNYNKLRERDNDRWTHEQTADSLGMSPQQVSKWLQIAREIKSGNTRILEATNPHQAYNIIQRKQQRAIDTELSQMDIVTTPGGDIPKDNGTATTAPHMDDKPAISATNSVEKDILKKDFIKWLKTYKGRRFNFLHCDFPFGIGLHKSKQGHAKDWTEYKDDPDTYWGLCNSLIENHEKILFPSSHIMFWFSMTYYTKTLGLFNQAGFVVNPFPLVWHKTDNKGILPDAQRGPRRIYETAFIMSLGDRKIIKPVANCYGSPTEKSLHLSEKAEPMLRHFFTMFVDEQTEILDPTCGSGSALRAAESLEARRVLGLEIDPETVDVARTALTQSRNKARMSNGG